MSNMKIMHNLVFDKAELSTVNVNELLPIANVQDQDKSEAFRTDTLVNVVIRIKHDRPTVVSGLVPHYHNLSPLATIQWKAYATNDWSGDPVIDSGVQPALQLKSMTEVRWGLEPLAATIYDDFDDDKKVTELWAEERQVLTQEIIINDPNNPNGFIDITRIYNGKAFIPSINFSQGIKIQPEPAIEDGIEADDNSYHTIDSVVRRDITFDLNYIKEFERHVFFDFTRLVGTHHDVYFSGFPDASNQKRRDYAMAMKFKRIPATTHNFYNNYTAPIEGREA